MEDNPSLVSPSEITIPDLHMTRKYSLSCFRLCAPLVVLALSVVVGSSKASGQEPQKTRDTVQDVKAKEVRGQAATISAPPALLRFASIPQRIPQTSQRIMTMAFSYDGKFLASGHGWYDRDGSVQVWEVNSGKRAGLVMLPSGVSSIAWTPDGKHIAASIWDSTVRVFDFPDLHERARIAIDRSASRLAVSPDGKQIMTAAEGYMPVDDSKGRVVQIWDSATGGLVRKCDGEDDLFRLGCATWSPRGKYVAAAGGYYTKRQGLGRLWFADTGKEAARLEAHPGYIQAIRFFPDDNRVATAGFERAIRIWESATGKLLSQIAVGAPVNSLDISPDGLLIACATIAGQVTLWDPQESKKVADLAASGPAVAVVAFSPDGTTLASGGADALIRLWNVRDRILDRELPAVGDSDRPGRTLALAPSGHGEFVIVAYNTGALHAFDMRQEKTIWKRQAPKGEFPTSVAVAPNGKQTLVGCEDGAVRLLAAGDGAVLLELKRMPATISAVAFGGEGPMLAAGDAGGRVWLWNQGGKTLRTERHDHQGAVRAIGFADASRLVTSVGADGTAVCRETASEVKTAEARVSDGPVASAVFNADGSTAVIVGQRLAVWDAVRLTLRRNVRVTPRAVRGLALATDGVNVLFSREFGSFVEGPRSDATVLARVTDSPDAGAIALSADNRVLFEATDSGAILAWRALPPPQSPLARIRRVGNAAAVATSPDGKWLAGGGDDAQVSIWNLETGELVETLPGGGGVIYGCQFSPDSRLLAAPTLSGTVNLWEVKNWALQVSLFNPKRQVWCVAFSPDGRWLASGGSDRTLLVTDTRTGETVVEKPNQDRWVHGVAFSPDGKMLYSATGSWNPADQPAPSTLSAWRLHPGKEGQVLELELDKAVPAHPATCDNLVVTPDSQYVVTGSADGCIKVWEAATLTAIRTIRAPNPVHRIHLLRTDPALLVFGDHRGGVYVCDIHTGALVADYAGHVGHVMDVTATIDGRMLVTAGEDDLLLFWPGPLRGSDDTLTRFLKQAADKD